MLIRNFFVTCTPKRDVKWIFMNPILICKIVVTACVLMLAASCTGDDRSGEQPFPPTVKTLSVEVVGRAVSVTGEIVASPNSSIRECGFEYWAEKHSTVRVVSTDSTTIFRTTADSVEAGTYSCAAFARNGMGISRGDTLMFNID